MSTLEKTVEQILSTRRITREDQTMIMATFARKTLSPKDAVLINQVYEALHQGRLRVVD